jgi:hypothetical protein
MDTIVSDQGTTIESNLDTASYFRKLDKRFSKLKHKHEKEIVNMFIEATGPLDD